MTKQRDWLLDDLSRRGVSRRDFLGFCGVMASALALPESAGVQIAEAIETREKPTLVWLEFQDCAGNSESFLRAGRPTTADIILDTLSVDYHETIMAAAGHRAEENLHRVVAEKPGAYIAVVEGSRFPPALAAPIARSAGARRSTSRARSAAAPPPRSRSAPAPPTAGYPPLLPTPPAPCRPPTRCPESRT